MGKYSNRDWPWCDPRLEEYMNKYKEIYKADPFPYPKPTKDMRFDEWEVIWNKNCELNWEWRHLEWQKLLEEYKDTIGEVKSAGNPYDRQ